jgi:hypothetical protein
MFKILFVSLIALANLSLPRAERWERPTGVFFRTSTLHPGLLLQGPELKLGFCILHILKKNLKNQAAFYTSNTCFTQEISAFLYVIEII